MNINMKKVVPGIVIALVVALAVYGAASSYLKDSRRDTPLVYSRNAMLSELWNSYKSSYIEQNTSRTLDKQQANITTSEGQSYTMMRAVWMDDKATFDQSWQWTKDNLQRDDKLMSWKFGLLPDGTYGIQTSVGGENTASDGDVDIALALLMAYMRWNNSDYLYDSKPIIGNIWEKEVVLVNGKPVLASNDIERNNQESIIVNPSYLAPYAYKIFAKVDPAHDWQALADNSYSVIANSMDSNLDKGSSVGLPPDWIRMNRTTGEISATGQGNLTTNYSYDALRTSWRLALDWAWYKDERARTTLEKFSFLQNEWQQKQRLQAGYSHDGETTENYETPAMYGGSIGYFSVIKPESAKAIYDNKLKVLYDPNEQRWKYPQSYYDDNWAWFGMSLVEGTLPNLTERL